MLTLVSLHPFVEERDTSMFAWFRVCTGKQLQLPPVNYGVFVQMIRPLEETTAVILNLPLFIERESSTNMR